MAGLAMIESYPFNYERKCEKREKVEHGLLWTSVVLAIIAISWTKRLLGMIAAVKIGCTIADKIIKVVNCMSSKLSVVSLTILFDKHVTRGRATV
ncbi:unnamed protein product [Trifolium pratense]|uniref:Uncharacterized protein n=1 Tax=Trifolium pratense TaxID=57577 RepID=A0ACB0LUV7_TRIPR|nr:unnamed protein product [Trifolium pratense]